MTVEERAGTADRLGGQLVRLVKLMERARSQHYPSRGDGVEPASYRLLAALVVHGPQRSGALAHLVHSDPSTVSRQVAALVRFGHAERVADPEDGRATRISATARGRETFEAHRARRGAYLLAVTARWSADEVHTLTRLLDRFAGDVEALNPELAAPGTPHVPAYRDIPTQADIPTQTKESLA